MMSNYKPFEHRPDISTKVRGIFILCTKYVIKSIILYYDDKIRYLLLLSASSSLTHSLMSLWYMVPPAFIICDGKNDEFFSEKRRHPICGCVVWNMSLIIMAPSWAHETIETCLGAFACFSSEPPCPSFLSLHLLWMMIYDEDGVWRTFNTCSVLFRPLLLILNCFCFAVTIMIVVIFHPPLHIHIPLTFENPPKDSTRIFFFVFIELGIFPGSFPSTPKQLARLCIHHGRGGWTVGEKTLLQK